MNVEVLSEVLRNREGYGSVLDKMNKEASVTLDRTNEGRKRLKVTLG